MGRKGDWGRGGKKSVGELGKVLVFVGGWSIGDLFLYFRKLCVLGNVFKNVYSSIVFE